MMIRIEYFAQAREAAGVPRDTIEVPQDCTLAESLRYLASSRGERLRRWLLLPDGQISTSLALAVNDRQRAAEDLSPLREGDEILIIPAVSGG